MHSKELLKGTLKTIVLKLLSEHGRMYGYEITQKVKELTFGNIMLTEGALYPTLHKLESLGLVTAEKVAIGKRIRKYYSLTPIGVTESVSKVEEFHAFVKTMQLVLGIKPA
jgi:PadR family transcriptional regulator